MIFLVKGTVNRTPYMSDTETFEDMRIVYADSSKEAEEIWVSHWDVYSEEFGVSYWVQTDFVNEALGIPDSLKAMLSAKR